MMGVPLENKHAQRPPMGRILSMYSGVTFRGAGYNSHGSDPDWTLDDRLLQGL